MNNFIGIDVSKKTLDVFILPQNEHFVINNDEKDIKKIVKNFVKMNRLSPIERIVVEATGGLQNRIVSALYENGLPIIVANPREVRNFAIGIKALAKTDKIDAEVLAVFAQKAEPEIRPIADKELSHLKELSARRRQLNAMLISEKNRLKQASKPLQKSISAIINALEKEIAKIEDETDKFIRNSPIWCEKRNLLETVPGIGKNISAMLITQLNELGTLNSKEICALVGVAPYTRQSGSKDGKRIICGGRRHVRSMLYMGVICAIKHNSVIAKFYSKLREAGKPPKVAITACMRKLIVILNSMIKYQRTWNPDFAKNI